MLCWCSFSGWGKEHDPVIYELEGSQYLIYEWLKPFATDVTQNAQPKIVDAPLKLIFRMGQWPCCFLFCQNRLPVCWLWIALTTSPLNYITYNTNTRRCSVDAQFQDWAVTICFTLLARQAAIMLVIDSTDHSTILWPYILNSKSLTLHWRSCLGGSYDIVPTIFACRVGLYCYYGSMLLHSSWIFKMHDQKSLTLRWDSFSGDSSDIVTSIFAYNGGQYYDYGSRPLHSPWIIQDAGPKIVDALVTLISRRW